MNQSIMMQKTVGASLRIMRRIFFISILSFCLLVSFKIIFNEHGSVASWDFLKMHKKRIEEIYRRENEELDRNEDKNNTKDCYETDDQFMKRMAIRMKNRRNQLRSACRKKGLPNKAFHDQRLMEAKKYDLLYCRVPKAGSTNMDRIYTELINEKDYPKIKSKAAQNNHSPHRVEYVTERPFSLDEISPSSTSVIIVRNPFVRLLSAFLMKVFNKGNNPDGKIKASWAGSHELPRNVSFPDFVEHLLIHPGLYSTLEKHWALYHDLCQPCYVNYDVIAQLETIEEDSKYFLTLVGAPRNVTFIHGAGHDGGSGTTPELIKKFFGTVTRMKQQELFRLYKTDFDLFGYSLPDEIGFGRHGG